MKSKHPKSKIQIRTTVTVQGPMCEVVCGACRKVLGYYAPGEGYLVVRCPEIACRTDNVIRADKLDFESIVIAEAK